MQDTADLVQQYFDNVIVSVGTGLELNHFPIQLFPNPADDLVNVVFPQTITGTVNVFNTVGQKVMEQKVSGRNLQLNVDGLSSGFYAIRIETETGVASAKFLKD